jgi:hypothetical protein
MDEAEKVFWITRYKEYQEERQELGEKLSP